jgi:hypothetical protein
MSTLKVVGRIKAILDVESGVSKAGKEWKRQSFVIDTGDSFNPDLCIGVFGEDKISDLSRFTVGQEVTVSINLYSREFSGKWYHNVDAFRIESSNSAPQGIPPGGPSAMNLDPIPNPPAAAAMTSDSEDDDLPF